MTPELEKAKYHFEKALAALEMNDLSCAENELRNSLRFAPLRSSTLTNLSAVLLRQNKWLEAKEVCSNLLRIDPNNAEGCINLGISEQHIGNLKSALQFFNQALAINPESSSALVNKGNVLLEMGNFDDALNCFKNGLKIDPNSEEGLIGLGNLHNELKQYPHGLDCFSKALIINPKNYQAKWNKSLSHLRLGQYEEGWPLYESRWHILGMAEHAKHQRIPLWLGENSLAGKTILIHAEQGFGDTIQMSRYLPILENKMGANVIFEVSCYLKDLMKTLSPNIQIIDACNRQHQMVETEIDFQCPIMSLPLAFKTTVASIPSKTPYLYANNEKRIVWRNKLEENSLHTKPFRVGITWSGSGHYAGKKNTKRDLPYEIVCTLAEDLSPRSIEFHGIQKECRNSFLTNQLKNLFFHSGQLDSFADTAALVAELDFIVSIDTAVAHLAGALGQKTLLLIPDPPDFMAMTEIDYSPWYQSIKLLRQDSRGVWSINKIKAAILEACSSNINNNLD